MPQGFKEIPVVIGPDDSILPYSFHPTASSPCSRHYTLSPFLLDRLLIGSSFQISNVNKLYEALQDYTLQKKTLQQKELEDFLFSWMAQYHDPFLDVKKQKYFNALCHFTASRGAFILFIFGAPSAQISSLVVQLAYRLNISCLVDTRLVLGLSQNSNSPREIMTGDTTLDILSHFKSRTQTIFQALQATLDKVKKNGKSLIVYGLLVNPELYAFEQNSAYHVSSNSESPVLTVPLMLNVKTPQLKPPGFLSKDLRDWHKEHFAFNTIQQYLLNQASQCKEIILQDAKEYDEQTLQDMHQSIMDRLDQLYGSTDTPLSRDGHAKPNVVAAVLKNRPVLKKTKVRYSTHFRRPKTLSLPRNPKCPSRAVPHLPSMDEYRVVRCPMTTESAIKKIEVNNTLVFLCDPLASKPQIRRAVSKLYNVKAQRINTLIRPDGVKKAFVCLSREHDAVDIAHKMGII